MLWEVAYAELHFTECLWPDFDEYRFRCALDDYAHRQRRFGTLTVETREEALEHNRQRIRPTFGTHAL
jgi:undecaprenyl diphosphate synthase